MVEDVKRTRYILMRDRDEGVTLWTGRHNCAMDLGNLGADHCTEGINAYNKSLLSGRLLLRENCSDMSDGDSPVETLCMLHVETIYLRQI